MKTKLYALLFGFCIALSCNVLFAQNTVCPTPTATTIASVTSTGATLTWAPNSLSSYYKVQYRPISLSNVNWIQVYAQTNSYTLTGLTCATAYEWQVQSICANTAGVAGASMFTPSLVFTTVSCNSVCPIPTGMATSAINTNSASAGWAPVTGSIAYRIQYRPVTATVSNWTQTTVSGNSFTFANLACGTTYEWQVQTLCNSATAGGTRAYSASTNFTTSACSITCSVPSLLTASNLTNNSVALSWTNAGPSPAYYVLQYRPLNSTSWITVTIQGSTTSTLSNLTCSTTYEWQVKAICTNSGTAGNSSAFSPIATFSTLACAFVCPSPSALSVASIGASSAVLSWNSSSPAPAYHVIRYRTANTSTWTTVSVQGSSTFTLNGLLCNTSYIWEVQAICVNSGTNGTPSAFSTSSTFTTLPCSVVCAAPTNLISASITTTSAVLSWTAPTAGTLYYKLQYRKLNLANSNWIQVSITSGASWTLSNLQCGTAYEWQVQTVCSPASGISNTSPFTSSVSFTTLACATTCPVPSGTTSTAVTVSGAVLSWIAPAGVSVFNLQYRMVTNVPTNWIQTTIQGTTATLSNLNCGTAYEWQIASVCSNNNGSSSISNFSPSVFFSSLACTSTCPIPAGLTSGNISSNAAYIGWQPVSGAVAYKIQYRPIQLNVPPTNPWTQVTVQTNTYTLANLLCNTSYEWQVQTICSTTSNGMSAFSAISGFSTLACPLVCSAPTGLFASNITPSSALVKWTSTTNSFAGNYAIRYRKLNTNAWITVTSTSNSKLLNGLSMHTYYEWQVQVLCPAQNGTTNGVWSAWSASSYFHTHFVISLTPNPADRLLKVEVKSEVEEDGPNRIELRNILGAVVYRAEEKFISGSNQFEIATQQLSEGLYFLSISNASGSEISKVYVKH